MQPSSLSTFQPSSPKEPVPYSSEALRQDLQRVRNAWEEAQSTRGRDAIYGYLSAVYGLVAWWAAEGRELDQARRALRLQRLEISDREDPFASIIRCTADPAKADKRTRSKWSRVMSTQQRTSRFRNRWIGSSDGRAPSMHVLRVSLGCSGGVPKRG
jgi:hypothetical protein